MRRTLIAGLAATVAVAAAAPATASADDQPTLADILLSDSAEDGPDGFDNRPRDFDIVTEAIKLFPDLVAAASDPSAELTVFLPTDTAFRRLVQDLTGAHWEAEADVFAAVAGLGTDTVRAVLDYHIAPGSLPVKAVLASDGAAVTTLLPDATFTVDVRGAVVELVDLDPDNRDPKVVRVNIGGAASNGYAHGIDRVLRPIDLPK